MGAEMPIFTVFVARMVSPELHLAAWGSLVFPVSMVVEGPVIMLLAASTALAVDSENYRRLRRYMLWMSGILSIAALKLGAASVRAVDIDERVIPIARENAEKNGVDGRIELSVGSVESVTGEYELLLMNILAEVIVPALPAVAAAPASPVAPAALTTAAEASAVVWAVTTAAAAVSAVAVAASMAAMAIV